MNKEFLIYEKDFNEKFSRNENAIKSLQEETIVINNTIGDIQKALDAIINKYPGIVKIPVPTISGTLTYTGDPQSVTDILVGYDSDQVDIGGSTTATNAGNYTVTFTPQYGYAWSDRTYDTKNVDWSISKALCNLTLSHTSIALNSATPRGTVTISKDGDGAVTVESSDTSIATAKLNGNTITITALNNGTATITVSVAEDTNHSEATETISVTATDMVHIYGAIWDGSSTTKLTRTDEAAGFSDPVPALSGTGGSSPFDGCYPWSDIEKVIIDGNSLVKIPKFWYKITKNGNSLKYQIANTPVDGFNVSPAHADRGDGKGERDYVYIGRYKCTTSSYKSVTGYSPKTNITRSTARSGITSLGSGYYMQDFALWWTVRMLYLVEFADWNSQAVIGYNGGNNSGAENTGTTDSMTYHTGTMKSSRTTYGTGVQYRWIEDPWGNVLEWCDGIRFSGSSVYVFKNPSEYSDSSGGVYTGDRPTSSNYISQWSVPTVEGYDWALYPSAVGGSDSTYIPDYCYYDSPGVVLCVGGAYGQYQNYGAFYLNGYDSASSSSSDIGVRLQYLP